MSQYGNWRPRGFSAFLAYSSFAFGGFYLGVLTGRSSCTEKILALPNSPLADDLRTRLNAAKNNTAPPAAPAEPAPPAPSAPPRAPAPPSYAPARSSSSDGSYGYKGGRYVPPSGGSTGGSDVEAFPAAQQQHQQRSFWDADQSGDAQKESEKATYAKMREEHRAHFQVPPQQQQQQTQRRRRQQPPESEFDSEASSSSSSFSTATKSKYGDNME